MKLANRLTWLLFYFSLFIVSLALSWCLHKPVDFGYSAWYQLLSIDMHIKEYVPQNRFGKQDFVATTTEQHQQAFHEINQAIHNNGRALAEITYSPPANKTKDTSRKLLTPAEVIHLQDVANLISLLIYVVLVFLLILVLVTYFIVKKQLNPPSLKSSLITLFTVITSITLLFALLGFERIFYKLHIWIFPDNHQWFFYYQDSLMSTIMKAPELFIYIGLSITALAAFIYVCLLSLFKKLI